MGEAEGRKEGSSPKAHCVPGALYIFQPTNGVSAQRFSVQPESHRGVITHQGLLSVTSKVGCSCHPHFTEEETEAQKDQATWHQGHRVHCKLSSWDPASSLALPTQLCLIQKQTSGCGEGG